MHTAISSLRTRRWTLLALAASVSLAASCGGGPPAGSASDVLEQNAAAPPPEPSGPVGTVRGRVLFRGTPPEPVTDPITENQEVCGASALLPRLVLGENEGVAHAFVYLVGVPAQGPRRPQESLLIDQKDCRYVPHTLAVPVGTIMDVVNSDPILHNVHGHALRPDGPETIFNLAQPVQGQRNPLPVLDEPGIVHLTCEAGHPWMSAYVFVADHGFVAMTDEDGNFTLPDVPPGTYRIRMWHEGVRLLRNLRTLQRYEYEEPYELEEEIVVTADGAAEVQITLELRSLASE